MATTLAVYNSDGCVGRCDARCHNARTPTCDCICAGRNHGIGLQRAIEHNYELVGLTPDDLDKFARAHDLHPNELTVVDRVDMPNGRRARKVAANRLKLRRMYGDQDLSIGDDNGR